MASLFKRRGPSRADQETIRLVKEASSKKFSAIFKSTGWEHLTGEAAKIQRAVEVGDKVELEAVTGNEHDPIAIAVKKDGYQIGWYGMQSPRKQDVYILLFTNKKVRAEVIATYPTEIEVTFDPAEQTAENTIPLNDDSDIRI